jgi:hypothetical protein
MHPLATATDRSNPMRLVLWLPIVCAMLFPLSTQAQVTPQFFIGGGTGGNAIPFGAGTTTTWQKWQGFYTPNSLVGAYPGNITKIYFRRSTTGTQGGTYTNFRISIGQIAGTTYPTTAFHSPMTQAFFAATFTLPAGTASAWMEFPLTTPVYYNPALSLVVEICFDANPLSGPSVATFTTSAPQNIARLYGGPGCTGSPSGSSQTRTDFGIDMNPALPNDAGITDLLSPVNFCAGTFDIRVNLKNFGTNALSNVTVNWMYDGVLQTPISWSTPMPSLGDATVTLGSRTFAAGVPHTLKAWTTSPNGVADSFVGNDTLTVTLKPALSGTFTIGGTAPDYPSFSAAAADLNANGICGPVVFNVRPGTYTEQVTLNQVSGSSPTNTITFQSENGDRNSVILSFNATTTTMHTLMLNGADWVRVRNMTIQGLGVTYARTVTLQGAATNNIFEGNIIRTNPTTSVSTNMCNIYCYYTADHDNEFRNNDILNASYATYIYGSGTTGLLNGWKMTGNRVENWYYMGLAMWYLNAPEIIGNRVATNNTYTNYVGYFGYLQNQVKVIGNTFIANGTSGTKYGLYVYYYTAVAGLEGKVQNNFVMLNGGTGTTYGIYSYYSNNQDIDFNTVYTRSTSTANYPLYSYYGTNIRYTNNIFYNNATGYTAYWYFTTYRGTNYNVYYTNGANLALWNGAVQTGLANLQTISGQNQNSIVRPVVFRNADAGDLHLAGTSQNDLTLVGMLQPEVTTDIDGDPRILPYRGADEACYILPNTVTYRIVDGENQDVTYATIPGTLNIELNVAFPDMGFPINATVNFYSVPANQLVYSTTFSAIKQPGQTLTGTYQVAVPPTLPQGYYRVNVVLNTQNSCGDFINYVPGDKGLLLVGQGQTPCIVWPGDVTNDGIVNYGDRAALNKYIFNANLRASWLTGPARYRADAATNPMTYFTWEGQAGAPWQTPDGCYMDADGNGLVNNFDLLPVKVNFLRTHSGYVPKQDESSIAGSFGMTQNYPNPFNPSTTLQYAVPEKSTVKITVTDMIGRVVAVLVDGEVEAGVRTVVFDASALESGVYMARYEATGLASGIVSSRIVKMTLTK